MTRTICFIAHMRIALLLRVSLSCAIMIVILQGCTDVVHINPGDASPQLVVDAWLTDESQPQAIRLTMSQPYFATAFAPPVTDASVVVVSDAGDVFHFENQADGNYVWLPGPEERLGVSGMGYILTVEWRDDTWIAESEMRRVPGIDSISVELRTGQLGFTDGHWAAMYARDLPGVGDSYWIKAYRNGVFLNKPAEMNIAYDAAFDPGAEIDGIIFIRPIREFINRIPDPDVPGDSDTPPWLPGDTIRVEIHSITNEAFFFLQIARDQMTNGDNTIFSIPLANTRSNVIRERDGKAALGFFNVSAVSTASRIVE